jgi:FkbM family methyltransferase
VLNRIVARLVAGPDFRGKFLLMRALLRPLDGQVLRSGYGPLLRVDAGDATSRFSLRCTGDYDPVFAEVSRLRPGMAFVDIGANVGLFSIVAAERVGPSGSVAAFEPNPPIFAKLLENLALNGAVIVSPFNLAVGADNGSATFDSGPQGHSGRAHLAPAGSARVEQISGDAFLNLVEPLTGARPTMVKIDVEGAEAMVIGSMRKLLERPRLETVVVEVDGANLSRFGASPTDLYEAMARLGFEPKLGLLARPHYDEVFRRAPI